MRRFAMVVVAVALAAAACGGGSDDGTATTASGGGSGNAAAGDAVFQGTCATCHGPDAMGIEGLGKALVANAWVQDHNDDELVDFLLVGRPAGDPLNTTGVDMPPKGGNPSLSDDDLYDVVAFLRTLQ